MSFLCTRELQILYLAYEDDTASGFILNSISSPTSQHLEMPVFTVQR